MISCRHRRTRRVSKKFTHTLPGPVGNVFMSAAVGIAGLVFSQSVMLRRLEDPSPTGCRLCWLDDSARILHTLHCQRSTRRTATDLCIAWSRTGLRRPNSWLSTSRRGRLAISCLSTWILFTMLRILMFSHQLWINDSLVFGRRLYRAVAKQLHELHSPGFLDLFLYLWVFYCQRYDGWHVAH